MLFLPLPSQKAGIWEIPTSSCCVLPQAVVGRFTISLTSHPNLERDLAFHRASVSKKGMRRPLPPTL